MATTPEQKAKAAALQRKRRRDPARRAAVLEYDRQRSKDPKTIATRKLRRERPDVKRRAQELREDPAEKAKKRAYRKANSEHIKSQQRKYYADNRAERLAYGRNNRERCNTNTRRSVHSRRRQIDLLKMDRPCYDCGGVFPLEAMDWDHLPGTIKLFTIGESVSKPLEAVIDEIAKCQLVCSNCHRVRTRTRKVKKGII